MNERIHIDHQVVYDYHPEGIGEIPAIGTAVVMGLEVRTVNRQDQLRESIDSGELGEIAREHSDRGKAVGFRFTEPKKVSMFVADHSHNIVKAAVAGAAGVAGAAVTAAIILYEHPRGKQE